VIRIQPNHIVFNNVNAIEDIYGYNTKTNKGELYNLVLQPNKYPPSIVSETYHSSIGLTNSRNKPRHAFLRRVMNPSFGPSSLKMFESIMNRYYIKFIEGINKRAARDGGIVEMNEWFHNLAFDVTLPVGEDSYYRLQEH
jgi:hypothetical protein